ncbi:MAG: VOC family protein [Schlesneria sp.]
MKFGYTILYVADVEATVTFYESAFGLKRQFIHESGYGEMITGDTKLAFASVELARSNGVLFHLALPDAPAPSFEIAFTTEDVAAAFQRAVDAGATPVAEPKQKPWGQLVCYVRDINGFLVELCSPMAP